MLSINRAKKITVELNRKFEKIAGKIDSGNEVVLGMHESATKLWVAVECKKGKEEIEKRIGSALFGVLLAAEKFGVKDLEKIFLKRMDDLKKELLYQKSKK